MGVTVPMFSQNVKEVLFIANRRNILAEMLRPLTHNYQLSLDKV